MVHGQYGNHEDPQLCVYWESDSSLKNTDLMKLWKNVIIKKILKPNIYRTNNTHKCHTNVTI